MEQLRRPYQGVLNIIRFNWHFYAIAIPIALMMIYTSNFLETTFTYYVQIFSFLILFSIFISLIVSFYVYDISRLYSLDWIESNNDETLVVNINAGFDETSNILKEKFKHAQFVALDFYDIEKHTEVSIKRARNAYPPICNTKQISTSNTELSENSVDKIFVILAAHEIRNEKERALFFNELRRVIKHDGLIYITEHLRDFPNFFAYNIGFFHFFSQTSWIKIFKTAKLNVEQEIKLTPFLSTFILNKNGNSF